MKMGVEGSLASDGELQRKSMRAHMMNAMHNDSHRHPAMSERQV